MRQLTSTLTAALVAVLMAGCSSDSDDKEKFTIMTQQLQLIVGESQKIETSGSFTARSTNEGVATVSADGTVTAVSEGDADVIFTSKEDASQQQTCHVRAEWRYHYFEEPILDFTMSLEEVKERETHELLHNNSWEPIGKDEPQDAADPWLLRYRYNNQDITANVVYLLPDKNQHGLYGVCIEFDYSEGVYSKIKTQLTERYGEGEVDERGRIHYLLTARGAKILNTGRSILYYPL